MKILQVMAGNDHGGAETAFVDMCIAMHQAGLEIEVATRPNPVRVPQLEQAGIKVHEMRFGGPFDLTTKPKLGRLINSFEPDIVLTWMARAASKTPAYKKGSGGKPYLVVTRVGGYYKMKNFRSVDYFCAVTPDLKQYLIGIGAPADKIAVINNFAEMEEDAPPVSKADFDTPQDALVLITLARLHPNKALDILLQSLTQLPGVYAWIAGEGPSRGELEILAQQLGVMDRVRFLGWRTDRAALLKTCDVCVFPSRVEPFGTVFAQAWAAKIPVVVSDSEGPKQFCHNGQDCLMVPKDNAAALTAAIRRMLDDKDLQARVVAEGYKEYLARFTKQASVHAYTSYFETILKQADLART